MHANQQSTWALNQSALDQLQAALAATCTAIWQLENFDHDACANKAWTPTLTPRDKQDVDASLSLLYLASRNITRILGMPFHLDPIHIGQILPVTAHLVARTPDQIDLENYQDALATLEINYGTR